MAGGVALFDYDNDGSLDIFFTNGAAIPSLQKTGPAYWNRLYHNNGDGSFTDVTGKAGLQGAGYAMGAATGDYDNDGFVDLYVTGVNSNQLFHNNGNGTFTDVTVKAGVGGNVPKLGKAWSVAAGWFDYNNDGLLDLFVVNYLNYSITTAKLCVQQGHPAYCSPVDFLGTPNILYRNNGDGTFSDVSEQSHISKYVAKAWDWRLQIMTTMGSWMSLFRMTRSRIIFSTTMEMGPSAMSRWRQELPTTHMAVQSQAWGWISGTLTTMESRIFRNCNVW